MNGFKWRSQNGMTLIEVLVALLVLWIGVMGYGALQLNAVRMSQDTYSRSQAMAIAQDAVERVRANVSGLNNYLGADVWSAPDAAKYYSCYSASAGSIPDCDNVAMAQADVAEVSKIAHDMLPTGSVQVDTCEGAASLTCVTVAWDQTTAANCDQTEADSHDRGTNASCVVVEFIP